jgi:hypothetical protein
MAPKCHQLASLILAEKNVRTGKVDYEMLHWSYRTTLKLVKRSVIIVCSDEMARDKIESSINRFSFSVGGELSFWGECVILLWKSLASLILAEKNVRTGKVDYEMLHWSYRKELLDRHHSNRRQLYVDFPRMTVREML